MNTTPRILFTDYNGIGNAIILVPVLRELEKIAGHAPYYCLDNPVFRHRAIIDQAELHGPADLVPSIWCRYGQEHWPQILALASYWWLFHVVARLLLIGRLLLGTRKIGRAHV